MANISITSKCNNDCNYCFAKESFSGETCDISFTTYKKGLDFLINSKINQVRLLGGEPTLHPDFIEMVESAFSRNLSVMIFSNGLIPENVLNYLKQQKNKSIRILLNGTLLKTVSEEKQNRILNTLKLLGPITLPGYNISKPTFDLEFLIPLIKKYNLIKEVRLGLAHPCGTVNNQFLHPKFYPKCGEVISAFAKEAEMENIKINFDCGFVPCMFPLDFLQENREVVNKTGLLCNPLPDILPDGKMIPCYPLSSSFEKTGGLNKNSDIVKKAFEAKLTPLRIGIYKECYNCFYKKNGMCNGGCLAAAMKRFRSYRV